MGAGKAGKYQFAAIGRALADTHACEVFVSIDDLGDTAEIKLGVNALGVEI